MTGTDWNSLKDNNVDVYAQNVTDRILYLVNKHIPNKHVRIRKSDPPWLSNNIKRLMRKRKRLYDKYKRSKNQSDFNKYKQVRTEVTFAIRKAKSEEIDKLSNKLKDPNIRQKDWWKTLKSFIKPDQESALPPLKCNDIIYSDDEQKAGKLNDFFTQQTILDEQNASLPRTRHVTRNILDSFIVTSDEVEPILRSQTHRKSFGA